jgi:hypothetical protein
VDCKSCKHPKDYVRLFKKKIKEVSGHDYNGSINISKSSLMEFIRIEFKCKMYYHSIGLNRCQSKFLVIVDLKSSVGFIYEAKMIKHHHTTATGTSRFHNDTLEVCHTHFFYSIKVFIIKKKHIPLDHRTGYWLRKFYFKRWSRVIFQAEIIRDFQLSLGQRYERLA